MKTTKKITKNSDCFSDKLNFYLTIAEHIKNNNSLPKFKTKQALNYYLKPLKKRLIINRIGYGVWNIDWDKFMDFYQEQVKKYDGRKVKKKEGYSPVIRGHGYHFYIRTKGYIWGKILSNKAHTKLSTGIIRATFMGNKVWFGDDFIKVYFPEDMSFMGGSAKESEEDAVYYLIKVLRHIENKLHINLKVNKDYLFQADKAHYAKIQDAIAKECNKNKNRIHCVLDGKEWFVIDNSFNLNEAETTGTNSKMDMDDAIIPTFNSIKEYADSRGESPKFTDIALAMGEMKNVIISQNKQLTFLKDFVLCQEKKINDLVNPNFVPNRDIPDYIG